MERQRRSPPKHRHDGTSPLPLGMDWSPPPKKWNGPETVWPHDSHTGWSYCVTIPTWVVLPKSRESEAIVFYRVQVGLQSPKGVTTTRSVLRRFNDFLKLLAALRKSFPKRNFPPAPPKGLLRLKSRTLLEERRCSLEEWITKLLSNIDVSRSIIVASFLELESAARSSFQDENQQTVEGNNSVNKDVSPLLYSNSSDSVISSSTIITPDDGSDTAYETSEFGTSSLGRDNISEPDSDLLVDEDLTGPLEKPVKYGVSNINKVTNGSAINGNALSAAYRKESVSEPEQGKVIGNFEKLPNGNFKSEASSLRGSLSLDSGFTDLSSDVSDGIMLVLPLDQQKKMNMVLISMQRRLGTAKTDMEDLISRLNQEIAVKDYLKTKVKDLEEELETTKERSKENLQQAILMERERLTQMQWDMEELRRKSLEMELKLKSQQDDEPETESRNISMIQEKDELVQELDATKNELDHLLKKHQEVEAKSKADIKVLVKEVKSLRSSQASLKQQLNQLLERKSKAEKLMQEEKHKSEKEKVDRMKLLHECEVLHHQLRDCSMNILNETEDKLFRDSSSVQAASKMLQISDDQIESLLSEQAHILSEDDKQDVSDISEADQELKKMLSKILVDNITLRKQVSCVINYALKLHSSKGKDDAENESSF